MATRSLQSVVDNRCAYFQQTPALDGVDVEFAIKLHEQDFVSNRVTDTVQFIALHCGVDPPGVPNPRKWRCNGARTELTDFLAGGKLGGPVPLTEYAGLDLRIARRTGSTFLIRSEVSPFVGREDKMILEISVDLAAGTISYAAADTIGTQTSRTTGGTAACTPSNWPPGVPYWKKKN